MTSTTRRLAPLTLLTVTALGLAACGDASDTADAAGTRTASTWSAPASTRAGAPTPDAARLIRAQALPDRSCAGRPGVEIPAVEIPEVRSAPVVVPDQVVGGETIPGFTVPGVYVPAQRVPAQCAVERRAPIGCLPGVSIPPTLIPATGIPPATIPGVSFRGRTIAPVIGNAKLESARYEAARVSPSVCRQRTASGSYRPSVFRPSVYRPSVFRPAVYRPSLYRPGVCVGGDCIPSVRVPAVRIDSVRVPGVRVPSRSLRGGIVRGTSSRCVRLLSGDGISAYGVCADVLFASNRASVRPAARRVLRRVAADIKRRHPGGTIRIQGHTDARGSAAHNRRLSLRRARSVRRWMVRHAGLRTSRIVVEGLGEASPVASNRTARGRAQNRRVVIGVVG